MNEKFAKRTTNFYAMLISFFCAVGHNSVDLDQLLVPEHIQVPANITPSGDMYIIDNFAPLGGNKCPHSEMVYTVALETLSTLGLPPSFDVNIHKVDLDFYSNPEAATIVTWYAHIFTQTGEAKALSDLKALQKARRPNSAGLAIPALYMAALIDYHSHKTGAMISTSFVTFTEGMKNLFIS